MKSEEASAKFKIKAHEKLYSIRYSTVKNVYSCLAGCNLDKEVKSWQNGAYSYSNIQMKIEHDWKMCYLARSQGSHKASIEWYFDLEELKTNPNRIELKCDYSCYESGEIKLHAFSVDENDLENGCMLSKNDFVNRSIGYSFSNGVYAIKFLDNVKVNAFRLRAELSKGSGENAWQHTQLFRQSLNDFDSYLFNISFYFD